VSRVVRLVAFTVHPSGGAAAHSSLRQAILDFSVDLDVNLLDQVVQAFFGGSGAEQQQAQQVLTQFQEHPESWQRVPAVLEQARNSQTKVRPSPQLRLRR
jgi:hypothetical protein